jgi:hypothetical protein
VVPTIPPVVHRDTIKAIMELTKDELFLRDPLFLTDFWKVAMEVSLLF